MPGNYQFIILRHDSQATGDVLHLFIFYKIIWFYVQICYSTFMPRGPRIDAPGLLQHLIARGIERSSIFKDHSDRLDFLERLEKLLPSCDAKCFAWVLVPNHFHLLIRTGKKPLSSLMRRLLTGYAAKYNIRHQRSGHLFQNRYKSIVCEEDTYLLELIAYIHLNPIRAGLVKEISELDRFPWSGHAALIGTRTCSWQETDEVLTLFGQTKPMARRKYHKFLIDRIDKGKRHDLTGASLVRSTGRLANIFNSQRQDSRQVFDERVLGQGSFVEQVLKEIEEEGKESILHRRNVTIGQLLTRVACYYDIPVHKITSGRKKHEIIPARSVFCYLATEYLQMSGKELAKILKISPAAITNSITRGEDITRGEENMQELMFGDVKQE